MRVLFLALIVLPITLQAQNIAQWRFDRTGIYANETGLQKSWQVGGPTKTWSFEGIGSGYSSAVVSGNTRYITGMKDTLDYLSAISLDGKLLWQIPYGRSWNKSFPDTRSTPTVDGDKVYVISGMGEVVCIEAASGKKKWTVNAFEDYEGVPGEWGIAESPLIDDDKVVFTSSGDKTTMIAFDKNTGVEIWKSPSLKDTLAYVSPILVSYGGKKIIVNITGIHVFGVDAENGKILFAENYFNIENAASVEVWENAPLINAPSPVYHNGQIYITSGYNHVGVMFQLSADASKLTRLWTDSVLDVHHGGVVLVDGNIYGSNWLNNATGNWCCIDWKTGQKKYEEKWECKGSIIAADGMLYVYDEKRGNVGLVRPNPAKFDLVSSFIIKEGRGTFWSHPAIYNGVLYIRHGDVLMAYDIKENK